jgi:DNA-binding transcriptional regulator YiaG
LIVRHKCDNPPCVNPRHLELGTHLDNMADARARGRFATGSRNGRARLTPEQIAEIRGNPDGLSGADLARRYGMSEAGIHYIRKGRSWKSTDTAA